METATNQDPSMTKMCFSSCFMESDFSEMALWRHCLIVIATILKKQLYNCKYSLK